MAEESLEQRVATLERRVADSQRVIVNGGRPKDWRRTIDMFADDPLMKEIFEEALKYREPDSEKARRRYARIDKKNVVSAKKS